MDINIELAKRAYPNGYKDYVKEFPNETPKVWSIVMKDAETTVHNGFTFNGDECLKMSKWSKEKFWTFITIIFSNQ